MWSAKAIHYSIRYIEENPVSAELVLNPEDWLWSSSNERFANSGLVSDLDDVPVLMK